MKERIEYIDLAKGICIFLVVLHHVEGRMDVQLPFDQYLRVCRMPMYFLLSGIFFKTYNNFRDFVIKKINKLLIPFIFFYLISNVCISFLKIIYKYGLEGLDKYDWNSAIWGFFSEEIVNVPIWFLWCLFVLNILFYLVFLFVEKIHWNKNYVLPIAFFIGFVGYFLGINKINIPLYIDSAMSAMPFFAIGYVLNRCTDILRMKMSIKINIISIIICCFVLFLFTNGSLNYRTNSFEIDFLNVYITGVSGAFAFLLLAKLFKHIIYISYCGRFSIMILVTHYLWVMPMVLKMFNSFGLSNNILTLLIATICIMLSYIVIIPIFRIIFPYVTAQKDLIQAKKCF